MIDVNAVIAKALAAERERVDVVRIEQTALRSTLLRQRDELDAAILALTAQISDAQADVAAIDAAAADSVKPVGP